MTVDALNRVISTVNSGINQLIQDSLELQSIQTRNSDAHTYVQKYQMPGAWGKNIWHAILDDAIRLQEENLKLKEESTHVRHR